MKNHLSRFKAHVKALFRQLASERQPTGEQRTANWRYCGQLAVCVWQLLETEVSHVV